MALKPSKSKNKKQNLILHSWLLAFLLFELSRQRASTQGNGVAEPNRMLELALTITAASLNDSDVGAARLAMQRGAVHIDILESAVRRREGNNTKLVHLLATFYTFRILLVRSWNLSFLKLS
jgi:hypothetical protein